MTVQSSFLIRCHLSPATTGHPVRAYHIHHVQTGAEFRSAALPEINEWMTTRNLSYMTDMLNASTETAPDPDHDGGVR